MGVDDGEGQGTSMAPPAPRPLFARLAAMGAGAQASVPGLYAWALTVAPAAWGRGGSAAAKVASLGGLASLAVGVALEGRWGARARYVAVWGLVITSAVTWLLASAALGPLRLDAARGILGMIGWALFALASAAPALGATGAPSGRLVDDVPLAPRTPVRRGDVVYIGSAIGAGVALQLVGWRVTLPERALLVRLVTLAAALALVGAATSVSLARHAGHAPRRTRSRLRSALPWLVMATLLGVGGAIVWAR
jgi:hypothetical protein